MATREAFPSDDLCTTTWRRLIAGDSSAEIITTLLRTPGCAERIQNYATECGIFTTEVSRIMQATH